jgi:hypothetical protein
MTNIGPGTERIESALATYYERLRTWLKEEVEPGPATIKLQGQRLRELVEDPIAVEVVGAIGDAEIEAVAVTLAPGYSSMVATNWVTTALVPQREHPVYLVTNREVCKIPSPASIEAGETVFVVSHGTGAADRIGQVVHRIRELEGQRFDADGYLLP